MQLAWELTSLIVQKCPINYGSNRGCSSEFHKVSTRFMYLCYFIVKSSFKCSKTQVFGIREYNAIIFCLSCVIEDNIMKQSCYGFKLVLS